MRTLPLLEIQLNKSIYPRCDIDADHVFNIVQSLRIGTKFDPIVVDSKNHWIIDGAHRHAAYSQTFGSSGLVEVIERDYKTTAEMFVDAVRLNARHGKNLTGDDRRHLCKMADELKIDRSAIAGALSVSPSLIGGLAASHGFHGGLSTKQKLTVGKAKNKPRIAKEVAEFLNPKVDTASLPRVRSIGNEMLPNLSILTDLLNIAGKVVGVGDWRPEKLGMFGRFTAELK